MCRRPVATSTRFTLTSTQHYGKQKATRYCPNTKAVPPVICITSNTTYILDIQQYTLNAKTLMLHTQACATLPCCTGCHQRLRVGFRYGPGNECAFIPVCPNNSYSKLQFLPHRRHCTLKTKETKISNLYSSSCYILFNRLTQHQGMSVHKGYMFRLYIVIFRHYV
jgi:hypothetical protein